MTTELGYRLFQLQPAASHHLDEFTQNPSPLIVMNCSAIHGHMGEYDEPTTCSLHQFLTGSSNLKAVVAGDCCVAIEFVSKLMQNEQIFFVFTASDIYPKMMHNELENELCRRYILKRNRYMALDCTVNTILAALKILNVQNNQYNYNVSAIFTMQNILHGISFYC